MATTNLPLRIFIGFFVIAVLIAFVVYTQIELWGSGQGFFNVLTGEAVGEKEQVIGTANEGAFYSDPIIIYIVDLLFYRYTYIKCF